MGQVEARKPQMGLTFEDVWAMFQESDKRLQETERIVQATARQMKETDRKIGKLGDRIGEMVERMVKPNLLRQFRELGFGFEKNYHRVQVANPKDVILTEVDLTLENGDVVMYVEVKTKPNAQDIAAHVERMGKLRAYGDKHNDKRKYFGAVAGMVFNDNEKTFALKNGFYVIEPSGGTFNVIAPEGEYSPREW